MQAVERIGESRVGVAVGAQRIGGIDAQDIVDAVELRIVAGARRRPHVGEVPAGIRGRVVGRILHLAGRQADPAVDGSVSDGGVLACRHRVKIGLGDRATVIADQSAEDRAAHRAGRVGLGDGAGTVAGKASGALATDGADGVGLRDRAFTVADKSADIPAGGADRHAGIGLRDVAARTNIVPDQSADISGGAVHDAGNIGTRDGPGVDTRQRADLVPAGHCGAQQADVPHCYARADIPKQPNFVGGRSIDGQVSNGVPLAVERSGEFRGGAADRDEARRRPHARIFAADGRQAGAEVDIARQRVARAEIHRHQLQLMRVGDGGLVFPAAERPGLAVDHEPAGRARSRKAEAAVGALLEGVIGRGRLRRVAGHGRHAGRTAGADAGRLPRRVTIPVGLRDGVAVVADQPADRARAAARAGHGARRIDLGYRAGGRTGSDVVQPNGAANIERSAHGAVRIAIRQGLKVVADETAGAGTGGGDGSARVDIRDRPVVVADDRADRSPAGDGGTDDADIAHRGAGGEIADQPDVLGSRPVDEEAGNRAALAVKVSSEAGPTADRREPGAAVPAGRDAGIDVAAERIGARQVVLHVLQVIDGVDQH